MQILIAMAVYNPNISFLKQQILSIKQQTYKNWKCIIFDDASRDITLSQLQALLEDDSRFEVKRQKKNLGSYHCFESLLCHIYKNETVEWVALCDQDDIWLPEKLETLIGFFKTQIQLVHSDLSLIDEENKSICSSAWEFEGRRVSDVSVKSLLFRNVVTGCSSVFRKSLLQVALPFPEQSSNLCFHHDHWLALCALIPTAGQGIYSYPKPLVWYRQHDKNVVGSKRTTFLHSTKKILKASNRVQLLCKPWLDRQFLYLSFAKTYRRNTGQNIFVAEFSGNFNFGLPLFCLAARTLHRSVRDFPLYLKVAFSKFLFDIYSIIKLISNLINNFIKRKNS